MKNTNKGFAWMIEVLCQDNWCPYLTLDTRKEAREWVKTAYEIGDDNEYRVVLYARMSVAKERFQRRLDAIGHL